jgi:hypothetical protein
MKQAQLNCKNVLLTGLSPVAVLAAGVALYFYKLDVDFHKPLMSQ